MTVIHELQNLLLRLHCLKGFQFGKQLAEAELKAMEEGYRQTIDKYKQNRPMNPNLPNLS